MQKYKIITRVKITKAKGQRPIIIVIIIIIIIATNRYTYIQRACFNPIAVNTKSCSNDVCRKMLLPSCHPLSQLLYRHLPGQKRTYGRLVTQWHWDVTPFLASLSKRLSHIQNYKHKQVRAKQSSSILIDTDNLKKKKNVFENV